MANITPAQIKMLQTLRSQHYLGEDAYRHMIAHATNGRTTSTKALTQQEAFYLIDGLVKSVASGSKFAAQHAACSKMRKKIIGMAREMGWWLPGDMRRVDMERVNAWCMKYGFAKKPLNAYTSQELPKLVSQFESGPYKHYLSRV